MTLVFMASLSVVAATSPVSATGVELRAGHWFNAPSIRIPDERTYVLFFYTSVRQRENRPFLKKLNEMYKRGDVVVVGLTSESEVRTKKFIAQKKIRFTVGARSKAYKLFSIERLPQIVVLSVDRKNGDAGWVYTDLVSFDRTIPSEDLEPFATTPDAPPEDAPKETLREYALRGTDRMTRRDALERLRNTMANDEFMALCDTLLETEESIADRGYFAYQRHLADPATVDKEPMFSPAILARHELREHPDDPRNDSIREYVATLSTRTADQLQNDFFARLTDDAVDMQIRMTIPGQLEELAEGNPEGKGRIREMLMDMLQAESDAAVRQHLVGAFTEACDPGDFAAADFLESQLKTEPNIRIVQPMMEYVIRYLRTGEE